MKRKSVVLMVLLLAVALLASETVWSQSSRSAPSTRREYHNLLGDSIEVSGFDPVAYFPEGGGKAQKGLIRLAFEYKGVTYRFSSEENRDRFKANPRRYLPAFGGWCAWAVGAIDKKVDVDPESFEIRDGRLYLFYRDAELDARALWQKNPEELRRKAEANWPSLGPVK